MWAVWQLIFKDSPTPGPMLPMFTSLYTVLLWNLCWLCDSLLTKRIGQKWCWMFSKARMIRSLISPRETRSSGLPPRTQLPHRGPIQVTTFAVPPPDSQHQIARHVREPSWAITAEPSNAVSAWDPMRNMGSRHLRHSGEPRQPMNNGSNK